MAAEYDVTLILLQRARSGHRLAASACRAPGVKRCRVESLRMYLISIALSNMTKEEDAGLQALHKVQPQLHAV